MKKLLLLLAILPLFAADPTGFKIWKAQDIKAIQKAQPLADYGNHNLSVTFREKDGVVEIHQDWADVLVIQTGEGAFLIGGTPVNPKTTTPGESRAASAPGAQKVAVAPGDIVHIPAGVPHQFIQTPGKNLTYVALKIPAK
jgi:mannose-6-phosphate isomerase-like protein (cupin superfamily)